jgi:hypothetical protein
MSALPRDLSKPRNQRIGEVSQLLQYQAGQANGQLVAYGCLLSADVTHNYNVAVSAGEFYIAQSDIQFAGAVAQGLPSGATTTSAQYLKVLVELDAAGNVYFIVGSPVTTQQSDAVLPAGVATHISVGYLAIPPSFTVATTSVATAGILNQIPYYGQTTPGGSY